MTSREAKPLSISRQSLQRMPVYLELLKKIKADGGAYVSAAFLAGELGLHPVQVRKDLASVSKVDGNPRIGFALDGLIDDMEDFLGCKNAQRRLRQLRPFDNRGLRHVARGCRHDGRGQGDFPRIAHFGALLASRRAYRYNNCARGGGAERLRRADGGRRARDMEFRARPSDAPAGRHCYQRKSCGLVRGFVGQTEPAEPRGVGRSGAGRRRAISYAARLGLRGSRGFHKSKRIERDVYGDGEF